MPAVWSENAVLFLLEQYQIRAEDLKKNMKHEKIWNEIAEELNEKGHFFSGRQCAVK